MNPRKFLAELKRRNVYRAAVGYAAVGWLLLQVVTQISPYVGIPSWCVQLIIVLLLAGFPIALAIAWAFEITPAGLVRTEDVPPDESMLRRTGRAIDMIIIVVLALAVAVLLFDRFRPRATPHAVVPEKSIAVLPFTNMTNDPGNAFFADGIQDDILTSLAKIGDLKVISRTSTLSYRAESKNLREIGEALGVSSILEGSVRRDGSQVVVTVQLIDARTDRHIWANRYDRTISNALTLQGELAKEIATALHASLSPAEKERVGTKPTDNADAYVLYLRARQLELKPDTLLTDLRAAEELFQQAVQLDPNFALAHAQLAITRAEIYHFHEPLELWKQKARSAAEVALSLQPNLSEAHQAVALCSFWFEADYDAALREFAVAAQLAPNDTAVGFSIAAIRRRQGHWEEALEGFERMQTLDPQDPNVVRNVLITNTAMRRWSAAAVAAARWRVLAPDSVTARIQTGYVEFWAKGDKGALRKILSDIPAETDPDGVVTSCRWEGAMIEHDFAGAAKILETSSLTELDYTNGGATPVTYLRGLTALAAGDREAAKTNLTAAAAVLEKAVEESPQVAERHANLGLCYAFLSRKEDAIREGRRAVELKPESKDAFDGAIMSCALALIYARVDEADLACTLLERLAKTHGAVDSVDCSVTVSDLKYRWEWDPLRNDPRFKKLIAE